MYACVQMAMANVASKILLQLIAVVYCKNWNKYILKYVLIYFSKTVRYIHFIVNDYFEF